MIEAMKHMLAIRMNLGDPDFVNISSTVTDMLSTSFAKEIRRKIFDNTTFPPEYYLPRSDEFFFRLRACLDGFIAYVLFLLFWAFAEKLFQLKST